MSLIEGLQNLTLANRGFKDTTARHDRHFSDISFPALVKAVESIEALARPQKPADSHIREWQAYIDGQTELLSPRAIRNLSWYPDVATDPRFWDVVMLSERSRNSAKTIQGLVYSYHSKWKEVRQLPQFVGLREAVNGFTGRNGILKKWKENLGLILFADSVARLAQEFCSRRMPLDYSIKQLRLFEDTQFFREVVSECARSCSQNLGVAEMFDFFLNQILSWDKHDIQIFKEHVDAGIKSEAFDRSEDVKARLINYVVNDVERLGDPRLRPASWIGIEESKDKVLQYLSKEDIVFFFKKVMTDDVHGRAKFWLKYVKSMSRSRPLLTDLDRSRLGTALARRGNTIRHYGRTNGQHSAFLLDFGNVLAIEFEGVGACYLYDAKTRDRLFPDFFTGNSFSDQILKKPNQALYRKSHQGDWQSVLAQALAQSGIRPS